MCLNKRVTPPEEEETMASSYLQTSTPVIHPTPASKLYVWKDRDSTTKDGSYNKQKRFDQDDIWHQDDTAHSDELVYDQQTNLFNPDEDGQSALEGNGEDVFPEILETDEYLTSVQNTKMSQGTHRIKGHAVTEDSILVPQNILPHTPMQTGLRVAGRRPMTTIKRVSKIDETRSVYRQLPRTEPRRPIAMPSRTPVTNFSRRIGLYAIADNTGDGDTTNGHRTLSFYDSLTPSPLESSGELRELAEINAKKNAKGGNSKKGRKVTENILPNSDESESEQEEDEDEDEEEGPLKRRLRTRRNLKEVDSDSDSSFENEEDEVAEDDNYKENIPSKRPKSKPKAKGRAQKQADTGFKPDNEDDDEDSESKGSDRKVAPAPKKQVRKKGGRKRKDDENAAFKPNGDESDVEEEYEPSKPKRARNESLVVDSDDKERDVAENDDSQVDSDLEDDESQSSKSIKEIEGGKPDTDKSEDGDSTSDSGSRSKSNSSDIDESNSNQPSGSHDMSSSEIAPDGQDELQSDHGSENSAVSGQLAKSKLTKGTPSPRKSVIGTPGVRYSSGHGNPESGLSGLRRIPTSAKDEMKHRAKQLTLEHQRNMLRSEASFKLQEEFVRNGNIVRQSTIRGVFPTVKNWLGRPVQEPPQAPTPPVVPAVAPKRLSSKSENHILTKKDLFETGSDEDDEDSDNSSEESQPPSEGSGPKEKMFYISEKEFSDLTNTIETELGEKDEEVNKLKKQLKEAITTTRLTQIELAAKKALGYQALSYVHDFKPQFGINEVTGNYAEDQLTQLDIQAIRHPPFSHPLDNNPYRHDDMYHRREIINNLTFPGNAMLADFGTDYLFRCCNCQAISEVRILFFQEELVWSGCICYDCFDHYCCAKCTRYTAPKKPEDLPKTTEMLGNFDSGKKNYESWIYVRGIWNDYLKQKESKEAIDRVKQTWDAALSEETSRMKKATGYDPVEYERTADKVSSMGLRSTSQAKRKRDDGNDKVEEQRSSKREKILERREQLEYAREMERRLPIPEADPGW